MLYCSIGGRGFIELVYGPTPIRPLSLEKRLESSRAWGAAAFETESYRLLLLYMIDWRLRYEIGLRCFRLATWLPFWLPSCERVLIWV